MKRIMSNFWKRMAAVLLILGGCGMSAAALGQTDYVIDAASGNPTPIPASYTVKRVITGFGETGDALMEPQDIFVDKHDHVYVADTGNNRVVHLNDAYEFVAAYNNGGTFSAPKGVFVDDYGDVFVADTGNQTIVHLEADGTLSETFVKPESDLLGEDESFNVTKLSLSPQGYLYTISSQQFMTIDAENQFKGYVGANAVGFDLARLLIRLFASKEQKEKIVDVERDPYHNFVIADDGMIYAVAANDTAPIQKINAVGKNIYPAGYPVETILGEDGRYIDPVFVDIAVDKNGIITVLEQQTGMLYQYDQEGNMLAAFGGLGAKQGKFVLPTSIAVNSKGEILVLDGSTGYIHILEPTYFIQKVIAGVTQYANGEYEQAHGTWQDVAGIDVNYPLANSGIAKALYKLGDVEGAMEYYRLAKDKAGLGMAFADYRYRFFQQHFLLLIAGGAAIIGVLIVAVIFLRRSSQKVLQGYYYQKKTAGPVGMALIVLFHPMEFFDIVKRERTKKFPWLPVVCLYLLAFLANYSYIFIVNFQLASKEPIDANILLELALVVLPLLSWTVASFAMSSIMNGESRLLEITHATAYCLVPQILLTPLLAIFSNLLSTAESGIYQALRGFVTLWLIILLFLGLKRLNDYSFWKNVLVALISLLAIMVMWAVIVLLFALTIQLFNFVGGVAKEISLKYFLG